MSTEDQTVFYARRALFYDALRSDRFTQGFGTLSRQLHEDQGWQHCCLGVACIIAQENGLDLPFIVTDDTRYYLASAWASEDQVKDDLEEGGSVDDYYTNSEELPRAVQEWYGFRDGDPELEAAIIDHETGLPYVTEVSASSLNDDKNFPFSEIAAAFERTYPSTPEGPSGVVEP